MGITTGCEHKYVFLCEEKENIGYDHNPIWAYYDLFFCERCLQHCRILTRKTQPARISLDDEVIWRRVVAQY